MAAKWHRSIWFWMIAVFTAVALLMVVSFVPLKEQAKRVHARMLLSQSLEASEKDDTVTAFQKALTAHRRDPKNEEALLQLARTAVALPHPVAKDYWPQTVEFASRTPEDLKKFLTFAMETGDMDNARMFAPVLLQELPNDPDALVLYVRALLDERRFEDATQVLASALERGVNDEKIHAAYVRTLASLDNPQYTERAREHVREMLGQGPKLQLIGLRLIVSEPYLQDMRDEYVAMLLENPEAEKLDRLTAYALILTRDPSRFEEFREKAAAEFDLTKPEELSQYAAWLLNVKHPEVVLTVIEVEQAKENLDLFRALLLAKLEAGQAEEVLQMTLLPPEQNPLGSAETLLLRARAHERLGNQVKFMETVDLMPDVVDLEDYMYVEAFLVSKQQWGNLLKLYRRLSESPRYETLGKVKLVQGYYFIGDSEGLGELLREVNYTDFKDDPSFQNFMAYLNMLRSPDITAHRNMAERLLSRFPTVLDFRLTLALAYQKAGRQNEALALLEGMPAFDERTPRYFRVIAAAILQGSGRSAEAKTRLGDLGTQKLLPEEKRLLSGLYQGS